VQHGSKGSVLEHWARRGNACASALSALSRNDKAWPSRRTPVLATPSLVVGGASRDTVENGNRGGTDGDVQEGDDR
jgi:hypothetical protein